MTPVFAPNLFPWNPPFLTHWPRDWKVLSSALNPRSFFHLNRYFNVRIRTWKFQTWNFFRLARNNWSHKTLNNNLLDAQDQIMVGMKTFLQQWYNFQQILVVLIPIFSYNVKKPFQFALNGWDTHNLAAATTPPGRSFKGNIDGIWNRKLWWE